MDESQNLSSFYESGIYFFNNDPNVVFVDPVRVLNRCYNRFKVSPSTYYRRFFESKRSDEPISAVTTVTTTEEQQQQRKRKRKRNKKEPKPLNEREQIANQRHQELRPLLLKAHENLIKCTELLDALRTLRNDSGCSNRDCDSVQNSLIEIGRESPLLELTLNLHLREPRRCLTDFEDDFPSVQCSEQRVLPAFNSLVANDTEDDAVAEILNIRYVLPRESCFYMSDLGQIRNLVPANSDSGFNLIIVDPPWENASAYQKSRYPTLPNRYFLSLPIKQLTHADGALIALWVTNREKLRSFVERELFPKWGVSYAASFYWLKVKANGSLISDLDLFHHRPYESLILGYIPGKEVSTSITDGVERINTIFQLWVNMDKIKMAQKTSGTSYFSEVAGSQYFYEAMHHGSIRKQPLYINIGASNYDNQTKFKPVKDEHVIMSIPGDYSRKPPIADLLLDYVPGPKPPLCIELFAREVMAGFVAWGNEPLHFQYSRNFVKR